MNSSMCCISTIPSLKVERICRRLKFSCVAGLLLLLLTFPAAVHAQFNYSVNNNQITIVGYTGGGGTVAIPATINGLPVVKIENIAFAYMTNVTIVTIPASVTSIGADAFYGCTNLSEIYFRGNAPTLGNVFVFYGDSHAICYYSAGTTGWNGSLGGLPTVELLYSYTMAKGEVSITGYIGSGGAVSIPTSLEGLPVTSIGNGAFANCTTLTGITIPNKVTTIGDNAFDGCTGLTSVTIPAKVISIGNYAFNSCTSLTGITIPGKITGIGEGTFKSCSGLTGITIPNSVTIIGDSAFSFCKSLTGITIPDSITSIGSGAFSDCAALSSAIFRGNAPSMYPGVFDRTAVDFTVYYFSGKTGFKSPTWYGYPAVNTGGYFKDLSGVVSLWDISGSYSGVVGQNTGLGFSIVADPSGKFTGSGTLSSDDGSGNVMNGNGTVNGTVKGSGTSTRISMTFLASGTGTTVVVGGTNNVTFTETIKLNCDIDGSNGELVVTGGSINAKETDLVTGKKISKSTKVWIGTPLTMPDDVTGDWNLTLNLIPDGTKYTGSATVQTSTGATTPLIATGSYSIQTDTSKITLKGTGCSLNMVISTSGTNMSVQSAKGKLFGQSLNFKAL